jgi:hypothetical protein
MPNFKESQIPESGSPDGRSTRRLPVHCLLLPFLRRIETEIRNSDLREM